MNTARTTYAIRVEGHLDDHWSAWLGGLDMTRDDDGATTVTVQVADQAQLHGVLAGLRDIGAVISELRTRDAPVPTCRSVLERPLNTERLTLRPATADDADPTWKFRQLESVNEWLTGCPAELDGYRELFSESARLATTVIVTLGEDAAAPIIGDFMLRREDAWAQLDVADQPATRKQSSAGSSIPPTPATPTPPKPCVSSSATASRNSACAGSPQTASSVTTLLGVSWNASACAANCTQSASHCTGPADGWTRSATPSSQRSGRRPERPPALFARQRDDHAAKARGELVE